MSSAPIIFQLKIHLLGISPMIWRRVLVPASISLRELHGVFQVAMGWEGIHLYAFDIWRVPQSVGQWCGHDGFAGKFQWQIMCRARGMISSKFLCPTL